MIYCRDNCYDCSWLNPITDSCSKNRPERELFEKIIHKAIHLYCVHDCDYYCNNDDCHFTDEDLFFRDVFDNNVDELLKFVFEK